MIKGGYENDIDYYHDDTITSNDQYEGYCKDLADELSSLTQASFEIRPVKDDRYGSPNLDMKGIIINIGELGLDFNQTAIVIQLYIYIYSS